MRQSSRNFLRNGPRLSLLFSASFLLAACGEGTISGVLPENPGHHPPPGTIPPSSEGAGGSESRADGGTRPRPENPDTGDHPRPGGDAGETGASTDAGTPSVPGPDAGTSGTRPGPYTPGYLHTRGAEIVDHLGTPTRITGINWFGLETNTFAPHGLWKRSFGSMLDQVRELGYNTIRLPYTNQLFVPGSTPNGIDFNLNPELAGKSGLEVMDVIVREAGARGLKIILDRHRPDASAQSPLWYTPEVPESRWISDWQMLAAHYKGNTTVIGADLHNEPHGPATWGDGNPATDWKRAAELAGNAVLAVNPELLIIVEGVETTGGASYWWGGNLRGAAQQPIQLAVRDQLVYSAHEYCASIFAQTWFSDPQYPANLDKVWQETFGYLAEQNIAPLLVGEFGTRYTTASDRQWLERLAGYLKGRGFHFTYWALNPDSGDTGGILSEDWTTVIQEKQQVLSPLLAPPMR